MLTTCTSISRLQHLRSWTTGVIACMLFTSAQPVKLFASGLGVANAYNVFLSGNFTATSADAGGRVAVGGIVSVPGYYSIGDAILDSLTAPNNNTLDVDSYISAGPAQVYYGNNTNSIAGNAYQRSLGNSTAVMAGGGTLTTGGLDPINFAREFALFDEYSPQLSQLTPNSTV